MISGDRESLHTPLAYKPSKRSSYIDWFAHESASTRRARAQQTSSSSVQSTSSSHQTSRHPREIFSKQTVQQRLGYSKNVNKKTNKSLAYLIFVLVGLGIVAALIYMFIIRGDESLPAPVSLPHEAVALYHLEYQEEIADLGARYDVDPYLVCAVINTESGWNPKAKSHAGALGLMQVMPETAEWMVKKGLIDERKYPLDQLDDPQINMEYGTCYLAYLMKRFDNLNKVVAGYNGGPANVERWAAAGGDDFEAVIDYPETKEYIARVRTAYRGYKQEYPGAFTHETSAHHAVEIAQRINQ